LFFHGTKIHRFRGIVLKIRLSSFKNSTFALNLTMKLQLADKNFEVFIPKQDLQKQVQSVAEQLTQAYASKEVVFLVVLNGAFMFAGDLMKYYQQTCEISFIKVSSYVGTNSTGRVDEIIGLNTNIQGKHVVILEDIVDTGTTIDKVYSLLNTHQPASIETASLLFKPEAFVGKHAPKFVGFEIPNKFVVGYGLDYNELGRNTEDLYQLSDQH
jgi:hypoxanthine phosphoribosyltransferase